jgi:hypothetical protein
MPNENLNRLKMAERTEKGLPVGVGRQRGFSGHSAECENSEKKVPTFEAKSETEDNSFFLVSFYYNEAADGNWGHASYPDPFYNVPYAGQPRPSAE